MFLVLQCVLYLLYRPDIFVASQSCLQEAGGADPPFVDDNGNPTIESGTPEGVDAIVPTYIFNCCANVTEWRTIVQGGGGMHTSDVYSVGFQVWRPSDTDSKCYNQVGENYFPNINLELTDGDRSEGFIREAVQPSDYITVQPGDVVGLHIASNRNDDDGIQLDEELNSNGVYYISRPSLQSVIPGCVFHIDASLQFTRVMAAPMLRVTLEQFPCPTAAASTTPPDMRVVDIITGSTGLERPATNPPSTSGTDITAVFSNTLSQATSSQTTSTTTASDTIIGAQGSGSIIVGVVAGVAVLLVTIVGSTIALIIGILVWRKKNRDNEKALELTNPNYTYDGVSREKLTGDNTESHYHVVGPHPQATANAISSPVYQQSNSKENLVSVYDEPHFDKVVYEDPTLPSFRRQDTRQNMGLFEEVGYYVPTLEERSEEGLKIYESPTAHNYNKLNFFVEDQVYWVPANTASDLYCQLASKKYREIPRSQIKLHNRLGSGQFGEVYKATWSIDKHKMELAVKTLKSGASEDDQVKFLQEAAIMGQFSHNNVIKMYGVVTIGEPVLLCVEILENGDLRNYLQKTALKEIKKKGIQQTFLKFAKDIAAGMNYLSKKCFVHRDLAARNILLDKNLTCKVADFGMARDLMDDTYYTSSGGKIPVKWTAPEAILYKKYSTDSDVWSYGMVLFEIWSVGRKPFATLTNPQVLRLLQTGYCQPPPPGCPRAIFQLMVNCWNPDHQSRPRFNEISQSYLQQPSSLLLHWSPEDNRISPEVGVCGAPLHEAERLHIDLQYKYEGKKT